MQNEVRLTPTTITVGVDQNIYSTQYRFISMVHCYKCNELVGTGSMWRDNDNSMRHLDCLSDVRLKELEMMSSLVTSGGVGEPSDLFHPVT